MPLSLSGYYKKGGFPEVCGLDIFYMWLALLQYPGCVKDFLHGKSLSSSKKGGKISQTEVQYCMSRWSTGSYPIDINNCVS